MSGIPCKRLACDLCTNVTSSAFESTTVARKMMRRMGWRVTRLPSGRHIDTCGACSSAEQTLFLHHEVADPKQYGYSGLAKWGAPSRTLHGARESHEHQHASHARRCIVTVLLYPSTKSAMRTTVHGVP